MDRAHGHLVGARRRAASRSNAMTKPRCRWSPGPQSVRTGTKTFDQRYPAAGTPNVAVTLFVIDPGLAAAPKSTSGHDPDIYLARVDWSKDGRTLYVQR